MPHNCHHGSRPVVLNLGSVLSPEEIFLKIEMPRPHPQSFRFIDLGWAQSNSKFSKVDFNVQPGLRAIGLGWSDHSER